MAHPKPRLHGAVAAASPRAGGRGADLADPHRTARRCAPITRSRWLMTLPDWLEPLPDAAQQRALDEWAIGELGIPGVELMERAGRGSGRAGRRNAPRSETSWSCAARATTAATGSWSPGCCASRVAKSTVLPDRRAGRIPRRRPDQPRALARAAPEPFSAAALAASGGDRRRDPRHRVLGRAAGPGRDRDRRDQRRLGAATVFACDVPSGVDASTGEVAGAAVTAAATATFHAAKPGLWIAPGKAHSGDGHGGRHRDPRRGPGRDPSIGLIDEARARTGSPAAGASRRSSPRAASSCAAARSG